MTAEIVSGVITLIGLVPHIIQVNILDNNRVIIKANTPIEVIGNVFNCDGSLEVLPVDVICSFDGPVVVRAKE